MRHRRSPPIGFVWLFVLYSVLACSTSHAVELSNGAMTTDPASQQQIVEPQAILLQDSIGQLKLGLGLAFLEDPDGSLSLEQALGSDHYFYSQQPILTLGYTQSVYWAKAVIANVHNKPATWYLDIQDPLLDQVDLYILRQDGRREYQANGEHIPFSQRALDYSNALFPLNLDAEEQVTLMLRFRSDDPLVIGVTLWSVTQFMQNHSLELLLLGGYFGLFFVMMGYHLFLYSSLKDNSYLYYVLYLTAMVAAQSGFNGLSFQYLWPESPWWNNRSLVILSCLVFISGIQFARSFLGTDNSSAGFDWALKGSNLLVACAIPLCVLLPYQYVAVMGISITVAFPLLVVACAICGLYHHHPNARYFALAWSFFTAGLLIRCLVSFGWVNANYLTLYAAQVGTAIEVVLLALALADRINSMREQKLAAEDCANQTREIANHQLLETNRLKDQFLMEISQELRAEVETLQLQISQIQMGTDITNMHSKADSAGDACIILASHVESLLHFSEGQSSSLLPQQAPFHLRNLVDELNYRYHLQAQRKGLDWRWEYHNHLPSFVQGDEYQLELVLSNILDISISGSDRGAIEFSCHNNPQTGMLEFSIKDNAETLFSAGSELVPELMTPGKTAKSRGFSFALCRHLARLMQGQISCRPRSSGNGNHYLVSIPLTSVSKDLYQRSLDPQQEADHQPAQPSDPTILTAMVVEDNRSHQLLLKRMLNKMNYHVILAGNGVDALQQLEHQQPDIIFMDCEMPIMDGFLTSQRIRQWPSDIAHKPIIAISSNTQADYRDRCLDAGMDDFLAKPIRVTALMQRLRRWAANQRVIEMQVTD